MDEILLPTEKDQILNVTNCLKNFTYLIIMLFTCEYHPFMLKLAMSHLHEYMWGDNGTNGTLTCGIIRASF